MTKTVQKIFVIYGTSVSVFLLVSGFLNAKESGSLISQVLFVPVLVYFVFASIKVFKGNTTQVSLEDKKVHLLVALILFIVLTSVGAFSLIAHDQTDSVEDYKKGSTPIIIESQ